MGHHHDMTRLHAHGTMGPAGYICAVQGTEGTVLSYARTPHSADSLVFMGLKIIIVLPSTDKERHPL